MGSADSLGADQRANLYRTKLTSLVRLLFPEATDFAVSGFANGAVATRDDRAVILVNGGEVFATFGAGLIKCRSERRIEVWVDASLSERDRGVVARCSMALRPIESVQLLTDKSLAPAAPAPAIVVDVSIPDGDPWIEVMRDAGLTVERSQGIVIGSLLGLEAARISTNPDGTSRLDVGVGHYDQEAFAMMNAGLAPQAALDEVVRQIRQLRVANVQSHPINRLGRTRWLASTIVDDPSLVGLVGAARIDILPEPGIRTEAPVALLGTDSTGARVGVVVAVGLDPSMIPAAADVAVCADVDRLVLVVPHRDRYALLEETASMLSVDATVVDIALPWSNSVT